MKPWQRKLSFAFLKDAIKDVQRRNSVEIADANIINDVIIIVSLNQVSQKFTLNERQDIAFKLQEAIF